MKIICVSCGHRLELDVAYNDFDGVIKCYVCDALLNLKTTEGKVKCVDIAPSARPTAQAGRRKT